MMKQNKILLMLGCIGLPLSTYADISVPVDSTSPFYEDSAQFNDVASTSEAGWGWSSAAFCDPYDTGCDTTIAPPADTPPATPKRITVSRVAGSPTIKLNWAAASPGIGSNFRYEVYQQLKNGGNSRIYYGTSRAINYNAGSNTTAKYQVKACNSAGCSALSESSYFAINTSYNNGGANTMPLESFGLNAAISLSKSSTAANVHTLTETDTALSVLGNGFDAIKGEVFGNTCWSALGADKLSSVQNVNEQKYSFRQVDSYESLATSLDLKRSGGGSLSFGGFSIGGSGSSSLYSETSKVTESSVIVASFVDQRKKFQAKQAYELGMASNYTNLLTAGQKLEFRKACGDKFIDTVTTGRKMLFTIRVESVSSSYSEIKNKTLELKASLDQYSADGNFSSSEKSTLEQEFRGYTFEIIGTQTGGSAPSNLLRLNSITELMTVLNNFADSANDDLVAIASTERDYPIPSSMSGSHFSVFTNYPVYRDILTAWGRLDSQVEQRCWMLNSDKVGFDVVGRIAEAMGMTFFQGNVSQENLCSATKDMIDRGINYCANQGEWSNCKLPTASACIDSINQGQCMERPELLSFKQFALAEARLDLARGGCAIGPCKKSASIQQCFATSNTVPDYSRNKVISSSYVPTSIPGLVVTVDRAWQVNYVRNSISNASGKYCLGSSAEVYGKGGWGSGGRYEANNQMFGFKLIENIGYSL
ncbi:hypothetical protein ORJ04_10715 [Rheinheimera baltica]|uniref:Fibronectin type-III domain-containing protein n=2 Tax=Rheinheimera baltica TaxID=67576 RepID=A0ABT9HZ85_9GAMM|nr:hypothetical protein [Rheinheimera baltica]MDP5136416.1 hypothetical protein [Rheinheimera baltica]